MSQKGIEQLIGKALADPMFLEGFLKDPALKIQESKLDVSPEELSWIQSIDRTKAKNFAMTFTKEFGNRKQAM